MGTEEWNYRGNRVMWRCRSRALYPGGGLRTRSYPASGGISGSRRCSMAWHRTGRSLIDSGSGEDRAEAKPLRWWLLKFKFCHFI